MHHKQVSLFFAHFVLLFFSSFSHSVSIFHSHISNQNVCRFLLFNYALWYAVISVTSVDNVNNDIISGVRNKS